MVFGGWKKDIKIEGQNLRIVYPLKEMKERIIVEGKIKVGALPTSVEAVKFENPDMIIVPIDEELSYEKVARLVEEILKI